MGEGRPPGPIPVLRPILFGLQQPDAHCEEQKKPRDQGYKPAGISRQRTFHPLRPAPICGPADPAREQTVPP